MSSPQPDAGRGAGEQTGSQRQLMELDVHLAMAQCHAALAYLAIANTWEAHEAVQRARAALRRAEGRR